MTPIWKLTFKFICDVRLMIACYGLAAIIHLTMRMNRMFAFLNSMR